ncbi:Exportin-2, partial [Quaeritorhiza haematococci]
MTVSVMEPTEQNLQAAASFLQQTLHPTTAKQAEQSLASVETHVGFPLVLLQIVANDAVDVSIRIAAALYFKNFIRKYWKQIEGEPDKVAESDRNAIKDNIVDLMISVPNALQIQLSEAVAIMSDNDFPFGWPKLLPQLISKLDVENNITNNGVLQTMHSIFKRWRHQFKSTELFTEIKYVLNLFAASFLQTCEATDIRIQQNQGNRAELQARFQTLILLTKIFNDLICQDLPEFIEDHHEQFMSIFHRYLVYSNPLLVTEDDEEAGPIEKVKTSICEIIDLFAKRYEEDFPKLPVFVETVWNLLVTTGPEPKNDLLVSKAIGFLTSVVRPQRHRELFANPDTLRGICEKVVLPNMILRPSDEDLFEDDPIEYIRRDLEGSDTDTRRRAASDLVRGLLEQFAKEITEIFGQYVVNHLQEYQKDPAKNWKAKDTALYLMMSLSAKGQVAQFGATQLNEYVQIAPIFEAHVLPELQTAVNGAVHPIIQVDAIKYLMIFRSQLGNLSAVIPLLAEHLTASNYVVYTYAAICIEKILTTKKDAAFIFTPETMQPFAQTLLTRLFLLLDRAGKVPQKLAENDYIMRAIMRVIALSQDGILPFVNEVLVKLTNIIKLISQNPSNPKFNHYVFESLAALVSKNAEFVLQFEQALIPYFEAILTQEVAEFMPYVFQLLSQLLDFHRAGIPDMYRTMLPPLLQPNLWESHGNIPALVKLLSSFLARDIQDILAKRQLQSFLGVCQKLIASRMNDHHGFELLYAVFEHTPSDGLMPFVNNIFILLLNRLTSSKTSKFSRGFLSFISFLFIINKPGLDADTILNVFNTIQP